MSEDWFCKIGEKTYGPLNGKQLKSVVAKGQLQPGHLVRRGTEGPWLPAGKVKGLFPDRSAAGQQAKPAAPTTGKPAAKAPVKATPLSATPTAAKPQPALDPSSLTSEPPPPAADLPAEFSLGGHHKHHVQMNVDNLHIETTPVKISSGRKQRAIGGLKKEQQKKLQIILFSVIGGGLVIFLGVFIWAAATGKFSGGGSAKKEEPDAAAVAAAEAEKAKAAKEKEAAAKKAAEPKPEIERWAKVPNEFATVPKVNVEIKAIKPIRGAPPEGAGTKESDVITLKVNLNLKQGETKQVPFTSWGEAGLKDDVSLKDDTDKKYPLLAVVKLQGKGDMVTADMLQMGLVFPAPAKSVKYLHLKLPASAVGGEGFVGFEVPAKYLQKAGAE